jgi:iron complex outermembrane receptor protein
MLYNRDSIAFRLLTICVGQLTLGGAAGIARAEEPSVQPAQAVTSEFNSQQGQIEEIVVTAQRRTESLKDVPISVQAITGTQLSQAAVSDSRDLAKILPTVNFSNGNSANGTAFSLRGVSSVAFQNGIQPSTAMVLDGVPVARQTEFISQLGDIDRIEVLNGPQGTLFGKNSTAGVISIVTKKPSYKFEALVEGIATNDSEYSTRAMVNVPVSDAVRLRLNAFYDDQHPILNNISSPDFLGQKSYGVNGKAAFDLASNVEFLVSATYSHTNSSLGQWVPLSPGIFGAQQQAVLNGGTTCRCTPTANTDVPQVDLYESKNVSGTLNWGISDSMKLVAITNYTNFHEQAAGDSDSTPAGITIGKGEDAPGVAYPFEGVYVGLDKRFPDAFHYASQELRLNYTAGRVNAIFGGYAQDYHDAYSLDIPLILDGSLVGATPGQRYLSLTYPHARIHDTTASVFGDTTVALTDHVKAFAGVRYTWEQVSVNYHRDDYFGPASILNVLTGAISAPPVQTINTNSLHDISNVSGRVGLQYEPTYDWNLYLSYSRGYKAPAADVSTTLLPKTDPIIKPEIADAVEIGAKARLFGNRLALNVALFDERIYGVQLGVPQQSNVFNVVYINAGTLYTKGVEADATWAATSQLRLSAAASYDDAHYGNFFYVCNSTQLAAGLCPNQPVAGFQNIEGQQAIGSPKVKYSVGSAFADTLPQSTVRYDLQVDWTWNSAIYYELGADPVSREPSHGTLNASVGFKGQGDRWEVRFFGKNLTNQLYFSSLSNVGLDGRPIGYLNRDFQRYGGVRVTYRY